MTERMIPVQVDLLAMAKDLNAWGWRDNKIEIHAGLGRGYMAQIRCGNIKAPSYDKAARLYNFWIEERDLASARSLQTRSIAVTT